MRSTAVRNAKHCCTCRMLNLLAINYILIYRFFEMLVLFFVEQMAVIFSEVNRLLRSDRELSQTGFRVGLRFPFLWTAAVVLVRGFAK